MIYRNVFATIALFFSQFVYAEPNFEIYNKDAQQIIINVGVSKGKIEPKIAKTTVAQGTTLQAAFSDPTSQLDLNISVKGKTYYFTITPSSKTVYVTFDSAHTTKQDSLYPQTGPAKTLWRKTQSNLSLSNNIVQGQIKDITAEVETKKEEENKELKAILALPEPSRKIALRLKDSKDADANGIYAAILTDEAFRKEISGIKISSKDTELIEDLIEMRTLQQVKKNFGIDFAGDWQKLVNGGQISVKDWNDPAADQLGIFAKAYEDKLKNPFISASLIVKYLPKNLPALDKINVFTKKPGEMKGIDPSLFQSFLKNVPLDKHMENHLPEAKELVEFGFEVVQKSGYPADTIGRVMASLIVDNGLDASITEGKLFGWNISDEFKKDLPEQAFTTLLKESAKLDVGQTGILLNFFKNIDYESVTKSDLEYVKVLGEYFKEKMREGFSFTDINSGLVKNLKTFNPNTKNLAVALRSIQLLRPKIDGKRLYKEIYNHPLTVVGAVLQSFLSDLMPESEQPKAVAIGKGFRDLDAHANGVKVVDNIRSILDDHREIIEGVLPTALSDTDKAAESLIALAQKTIDARIDNTPIKFPLAPLDELVQWIVASARPLRTDPSQSVFADFPLTESDQSLIRMGLRNIRLAGLLDGFIGRAIIERVLTGSPEFREQLSRDAQKRVAELTAEIATGFAGALPSLIKNFNINKYLDFLLKVGQFQENKIQEPELEKEAWKFLKLFFADLAKLSGTTLPHALDAIRDFGMEKEKK